MRRHRAPWVPVFLAATGVLSFAGIGHAQARSRPASQAPTWTISPRPNLVIDAFGDSLPLAKVEGAARLRDGSIVLADQRLNKVFFCPTKTRRRMPIAPPGPSRRRRSSNACVTR